MKRKTPVAYMSMNESSYQRSKEESAIGKYLNNSMDDDDSDDRIQNNNEDATICKDENKIEESMKDDTMNISKKSNKSIKRKVIDPIASGFYGKKVEN